MGADTDSTIQPHSGIPAPSFGGARVGMTQSFRGEISLKGAAAPGRASQQA